MICSKTNFSLNYTMVQQASSIFQDIRQKLKIFVKYETKNENIYHLLNLFKF